MNKRFEKWRRSESGQYHHLERGHPCRCGEGGLTLNEEAYGTSRMSADYQVIAKEDIEKYEKTR